MDRNPSKTSIHPRGPGHPEDRFPRENLALMRRNVWRGLEA